MALYQVNAGDRILAADINQFYNLVKGVAASGESVTYIYNAAGVLVFQPSSNPAAGTEFFQIKNNAGTVQSAFSSDGRFYSADGLVGTPGHTFESDKTMGLYRIGSNDFGISVNGVKQLELTAAAATIVQPLTATLATAAQPNIVTIGKVNGSGTRSAGDLSSTAGGGLADATGVTVTLTLPAGTSGKVLITVSGGWGSAAGGGVVVFGLLADGAQVFEQLDVAQSTANQPVAMSWLATGLAAGARIFKLQWRTVTQNGTLLGGTSAGRVTTITAVEV